MNSRPYGKTYGEWAAEFWKWLYSMPVDANPLFDTADPSAGQSGRVWFLGGTFAVVEVMPGEIVGVAERHLTVPPGTALFFPLVNVECGTIEGNGETEAELRACANFFADFIVPESLFVVVDGKPLKNLGSYRVESPLFTYGPLPDNNLLQAFGLDAPEGSTSPAVADGFHVMLTPLSAGEHTIHFGGTADLTSIGGPVFSQDITYHITVTR